MLLGSAMALREHRVGLSRVSATLAANPKAKYLLIVGEGINQLDASGEDVIHNVVQRLRDTGVAVGFSGLKKQVLDVMRNTGLYDYIGESNLFRTEDAALEAISHTLGEEAVSPLRPFDTAAQAKMDEARWPRRAR